MDSTPSSISASSGGAVRRGGKLAAAAVIAFFTLLLVPVAQMFVGIGKFAPIDENRRLADPPAWQGSVPQAVVDAQKWFEDHYGFRELLIRLKTQVDYSLFGVSTRIHIGREGFLFYRAYLDVDRPAIDRFVAENFDRIVQGAEGLDRQLKRSGRRLVLLIAPTKDVIYPEMVPDTASRAPQPSQVQRIRARFAQVPGLILIDPAGMLIDLKRIRPVYHRTDSHWNSAAAFEVAKVLVDRIASEEGRTTSPWDFSLRVVNYPWVGGEARFMPLFYPPGEDALFAWPTWPREFTSVKGDSNPLEESFVAPAAPNMLPCAVVVHDSFWGGIHEPAIPVFEALHLAKWYGFGSLDDVLKAKPECKYVIYQFVEGNKLAWETLAGFKER